MFYAYEAVQLLVLSVVVVVIVIFIIIIIGAGVNVSVCECCVYVLNAHVCMFANKVLRFLNFFRRDQGTISDNVVDHFSFFRSRSAN